MEVVTIQKGVIDSYSKKKKWRKITSWIIAITGSIIAVVAVLSYYGLQVGSFVISMTYQNARRSIYLFDNEEFTNPQNRMTAAPLKNAYNSQYNDIPEYIDEGLGSKNGYSAEYTSYQIYFAYSFYIANTGDESVDYKMSFTITNVQRDLDKILRVMVIRNGEKKFYAEAKEDGKAEILAGSSGERLLDTTPFVGNTICEQTFSDFDAGEHDRYTVVFWLDGWDEDETQDMLGGALKLSLKFTVL